MQRKHATFLHLHIIIENGIFVCDLFDKRDTFPFLLFACLNYRVIFHNSCLWFNIFRFFKVAKYTLRLTHFILCVLELYSRMVRQEVNQNKFSPQIKKVFQQSPEILNKYQSSNTRNTELTNY